MGLSTDWSNRTIIIIRHGETDWNRIGRLQGQMDVPLNETGRSQARRNGRALADYLSRVGRQPEEFTWFASPLGRTRETLNLVRQSMQLEPDACRFDDRLKEFTFGEWEGEILNELKRKVPDAYRARRQDKWNFQPPGGESYEMLMQRVLPWLQSTEGDLITVTHGGVIRVLWHLLENRQRQTVVEEEVIQEKIYVFQDGVVQPI